MGAPVRQWSHLGILFGGLVLVSTSGPFFLASRMDPFTVGFFRMALSGGILLLYALLRHPPWRDAAHWGALRCNFPALALGALIFALHLVLWMTALEFTSLGSSALLLVAQPAAAITVGGVFGERFRPAMGLSLALALAAVFLVTAGDLQLGPRKWIGDGLGVLAALCTVLFVPVTRRARARLPMALFLAVIFLLSAVALAPMVLLSKTALARYGWEQWRWLLGIVLVSTIGGHGLVNLAARRFSLFRLNVVTLLQPLLVLAIGASLFEVHASPAQLLGFGMLVLAVVVGLWGTRDTPLVHT